MNPPPLPSRPTPSGKTPGSFKKVLAGILIGIAPMVVSLLIISGVSQSKNVDPIIMGLFASAAVFSLVGGTLVAVGATTQLGARIAIAIAVALGLFAFNVVGGIFFGCLILLGKGL
jgi:chromate transport protein ChrA